MSLFPAYSDESASTSSEINVKSQGQNRDWLSIPSFAQSNISPEVIVIDSPPVVELSDDSEPEVKILEESVSKSSHRHRHKKKKKKSSKPSKHLKDKLKEARLQQRFPDDVNAKYYEDKTRQAGNLTVQTLHRPPVPRFSRKYLIPVGSTFSAYYLCWGKSGRIGRYFQVGLTDGRVKIFEGDEEEEEDVEEDKIDKTGKTGEIVKCIWRTSRLELEVQHATGSFNQKLMEHPHDIRAWLEFLRFQDRASELRFRGGCSRRAMAQRKLDILSKALQENPRSWLLLREKVHLEQILYPPDELEQKMAKEVEEATSIGPWLAFMKILQSRASTTEVSINYGKAMETARKEGRAFRRRTGKSPVVYDEHIIDLLFCSGLYMRQAGLWERLWTLLRMYLELNVKPVGLSEEEKPEIKFDICLQPTDKEVEELENEVFKSGLPLSEIWLRIEGLRQSVRWLPLLPAEKDESDGDLQRYVFPEDVSELVQPLATVGMASSGIFTRLATITLLLLKVPLLPCRDTALRRCGFPSWSCDTPEVPLTAVFSTGPWDWCKKALPLDLLGEMIAGGGGPQYLLPRPGQDLFLLSIQRLFKIFATVVNSPLEKQCFGVWWLRFERWLLVLEGYASPSANFNIAQKRKKNLKSTLKEFLSHEANRSSLALYREYALIEAALGKTESAVKTLCTAAALGGYPVVGVKDRAELCSIYRALAEVILKEGVDKVSSEHQKFKVLPSASNTDANHSLCDPCSSSSPHVLGVDSEMETTSDKEKKCDDTKEDESADRIDFVADVQNSDINKPSCSYQVSAEDHYPKCLIDGAETVDVMNVSLVNMDMDTAEKKKSRWDMREAPVGAGGRKPRWTAASVFMGSLFSKNSLEDSGDANASKDVSQNGECTKKPKSRHSSKESVKLPESKGKRKGKDKLNPRPKKISTCEQQVITVLTCLGLGKPLDTLDRVATRSDIDSALQRFKTVSEEVLKETCGTCQCPEVHESGCKCLDMNSRGGGGMECFQSYFVVEWVSCRAWLLSLVESVWAAGAAFEEALNKLVKITVEDLEEVEEKDEEEAETTESSGAHRLTGGRYNPVIVRIRNIREAFYEGYITMLLSRRWSEEARSGLYPILSDVIRRAMSEFPENVHFAAAVAITESDIGFGGSPWWTVTSYFDGGLGRAGGGSPSLFGKVFLILLAEQRRKRTEEGRKKGHEIFSLGGPLVEDSCSINRLRNVFRRLVADSGAKGCPLLWRLYLRFVGAMEGPIICKGIVYRGLQECPWVKAFYLDAARLLPEENAQLQDLITEKELRLHVSSEELEILRD
ncbi:nuclear exosome regulator NRDE2 [Hetaerina americana]|uniref:nuclear exosome regulator NRDE2 n=1 Tax=Hetaerina americana TaxID=62018 RepID=UPI003A7F15DA